MIRAFCELPAGLAAVSLRLHGGPHCRPPISRMGNKAGYSEVILAALGLRSGEGAGAYVWAEADPDVRALLRAYPDPEMLRRIADIIRGWKDEEPRALWERLRAERKARGPAVDDVGAAGCIVLHRWSFSEKGPDKGYGGPGCEVRTAPGGWTTEGRDEALGCDNTADRCHRLAEYASIVASNRLIHVAGPDLRNTGAGGTTFGGEFSTSAAEVARGFERVAGWAWSTCVGHPGGGGFIGEFRSLNPAAQAHMGPATCAKYARENGTDARGWPLAPTTGTRRVLASAFDDLNGQGTESRWPPVAVLATLPTADDLSAMLGTPGDLDGVVIYMDPPYQGTTGYLADLPRADVVRLARGYDAAGAVVCVSEAEPVIDGWHAVDIAAGRKGQKRTFSKQQREVLTMNREPAHRVAVQHSLFGGAA